MLRALILSTALTALVSAPAAAQPPPDVPAAGAASARANRGAPGGLTNGELVAMLDTYALVQAQETLRLDDGQYGQFVVRLKNLQQTRRKNQQQRNQILQDLRRLSSPQTAQPDENAIRERLKSLRDLDDRAAIDMRHAYDSVDELLSVTQQARFRVFEENIERRKLDLLVRARERAARLPRRSGSF
jgi:3-oxoacyl-ACP reductase-like protein